MKKKITNTELDNIQIQVDILKSYIKQLKKKDQNNEFVQKCIEDANAELTVFLKKHSEYII